MRKEHLYGRGFGAAVIFVLLMALTGTPGLMAEISLRHADGRWIIFAAMTMLGALLASIPDRIRRRESHGGYRVKRLACAFGAGVLLTSGLKLAQVGELALVCGAMQGGLGALVFAGCAAVTALIVRRMMGRWLA